MSVRIRRAKVADAPAICALFHRSFTATFGHNYPAEDLAGFLADCPESRFQAEISNPDFAVFVGENAAGDLLGYCTLGQQDLGMALSPPAWVLRQLYLEEAAKGSGLAQSLMQTALQEAKARQVKNLYLTVWIENQRARRFYERFGFQEVGAYAFQVGRVMDDDRILKLSL